jgi:hypothetical protein
MLDRLSLRIRILLFFALLAGGAIVALAAGLALATRSAPLAPEVLQGALAAGFAILLLVVWVWFLFDHNVARAIDSLASAIRARVHAGIEHDLAAEAKAARYLGDLAPAAEAIARSLVQTRNALAESVARETTRLAGRCAGGGVAVLGRASTGVLRWITCAKGRSATLMSVWRGRGTRTVPRTCCAPR